MEYCLIVQRNELPRHEKAWRDLWCIWLSERANLKKLHSIGTKLLDVLEMVKLDIVKRSAFDRG